MMKRRLGSAGLILLVTITVSGGTLLENFSGDPRAAGWRDFGNSGLFTWDSTNGNLRVTWDSSQANSYFFRSLGTILARDDAFSLQFDLGLTDIQTNAKSGPFEIAVSLFNFSDATRPEFWRGSGINQAHGMRSAFEFDYFPAGYLPGWGPVDPSICPTLISRDNDFAVGFELLELTNGATYHIRLNFDPAAQALHTSVTLDGMSIGPIADVALGTNFSDFRLDTLAVASYSDTGDDFDSVLAHGVVDNLAVTLPPPPVTELRARTLAGVWQVDFAARTNWVYQLERTADLHTWTAIGAAASGNAETMTLKDTNAPPGCAFYRVSAQRP